jgi:hypothetical protein
MEFFYNNYDVIFSFLISGILGALGQTLRIWLGVYKLNKKNNPLTTTLEGSNAFFALGGIFIGFIIGILVTLLTDAIHATFSLERIVALIATGYTVTDFIEIRNSNLVRKQITGEKSDLIKNSIIEFSSNPYKNELLVS